MNKGTFILAAALGFSLFLISCKHDKTDISAFKEICFNTDVKPIFVNNCAIAGCHTAGNSESGYVLDNYQGIMQGISPGNPLKSKIYKAITNEWINMMPPDNPLNQEQRTTIRLWIDQGADTICPGNN